MAQPRHSKKRLQRSKAKPKKLTVAAWKRKLWPVFAKWIKERDNHTCITCKHKVEGIGAHAGHYIPKSIGGLALYFHEMNVHCQCYHCNINLGGYGAMYHQQMVAKYGQENVDNLWRLKNKTVKELNWEELWERYQPHSKK